MLTSRKTRRRFAQTVQVAHAISRADPFCIVCEFCDLCILRFCASPAAPATKSAAGSLYAPDVATVYVPMIESDSYRRDLGERLTEAVIKEIELKTPYKVVGTPDADSILSARLLGDTRRTLVENAFDDPRVSETELRAEVTWLNRRRLPIVPVQTLAVPPELVLINQTSNLIPEVGPIGRHVAAAGDRAAGAADRLHDGSAVVSRRTVSGVRVRYIGTPISDGPSIQHRMRDNVWKHGAATRSDIERISGRAPDVATSHAHARVSAAAARDGHRQRHAGQLFRRRAVSRCRVRRSLMRLQLVADGADLLDIGGESTRPYSRAGVGRRRAAARAAGDRAAGAASDDSRFRSTRARRRSPVPRSMPARRSSTTSPAWKAIRR